jgi:flavin-dependent dehydrogenase
VAAGDAAAAFDPLSSQGVLMALRTGKLASFVALDHLLGRADSSPRYDALLRREYEGYQATRRSFYREEQRWPDAPFWARRTRREAA